MQISHARLEDLTNISYPPHSINVELGKELGYDDDVLDLMQKLPYVNRPDHWWDRKDIWDDTDFADYRLEDYLRIVGRRPFWRFNDEPCIESHILPIAYPHRNYGWLMLLDTKLEVIRAYTCGGPPWGEIEYHRDSGFPKPSAPDPGSQPPFDYKFAPCIPAAEYLRTLIDCYRSLDRIPILDPQASDPSSDDKSPGPYYKYDRIDEQRKKERASLKRLYKQYGWPDNWRREELLYAWGNVQRRISSEFNDRRSPYEMEEYPGGKSDR